MNGWERAAVRAHANMLKEAVKYRAKISRRIDLAIITTPDGPLTIGLEYHDGVRALWGRIACEIEQRIEEQPEGGYAPGNPGAVTAMAFIRDRYAEPTYQLKMLAGWRDWAYFCTASARGIWHTVFHRSRFPIPPQGCERCRMKS